MYINQNYSVIWNAKGKYYPIYHFIKDWVVKGMQMNVIILDATADVLSDYKKTPFRLIQNSGKMYSSPITFQEFPMSLERWLFEKDVDDNTIRDRIQDIVDELADQIQQASPLLIVTWKYMVARDSDPDKEDKHLNLMKVLEEELNKKDWQENTVLSIGVLVKTRLPMLLVIIRASLLSENGEQVNLDYP